MVAVMYFSHHGKNKQDGSYQYINVGNTEIMARKIGKHFGISGIKICAINSYSEDYFETKKRSKKEFMNNEPVLIAPLEFDDEEQHIFLGFPNWWGDMPQAVKTFLQSYDFTDKTIYPFVTHEGSQFGQSVDTMKRLLPDSFIMPGLPVRGTMAYKSEKSVNNWLKNKLSEEQ